MIKPKPLNYYRHDRYYLLPVIGLSAEVFRESKQIHFTLDILVWNFCLYGIVIVPYSRRQAVQHQRLCWYDWIDE